MKFNILNLVRAVIIESSPWDKYEVYPHLLETLETTVSLGEVSFVIKTNYIRAKQTTYSFMKSNCLSLEVEISENEKKIVTVYSKLWDVEEETFCRYQYTTLQPTYKFQTSNIPLSDSAILEINQYADKIIQQSEEKARV